MSIEPAAQSATRHIVNWRSGILVGASVAGGLTLNMMVLASTPAAFIEAAADDAGATSGQVEAFAPLDTEAPAPEATLAPTSVAPDPSVPAPSSTVTPAPAATPLQSATAAPAVAAPALPAPQGPVNNQPASPLAPQPTQPPQPPTPVSTSPVATTSATTTTTASTTTTTTAATTTIAPATTAAPTTPPAHTTTYPSFAVSGVAEIYLAFVDGRDISVYSVVRQTNWVHQVDKNGPRSVEVKFFNVVTEQEAEFHAQVDGGSIKVEND